MSKVKSALAAVSPFGLPMPRSNDEFARYALTIAAVLGAAWLVNQYKTDWVTGK